tara:strand:+ start:221 stop:457 length:237 start_codon:yes stop_codon:yes gene_type:complete
VCHKLDFGWCNDGSSSNPEWSYSGGIRNPEASGRNRRKGRCGKSGLTWDVVESLPASEDVKRQTGPWRDKLKAYLDSL